MVKLSAILYLLLLSTAEAKTVRIYVKEKPVTYEVPDEKATADLTCADADRPYIVLSKADKAKLEDFIKRAKHEEDPNLALP